MPIQNSVTLIGRLTRDPETRQFGDKCVSNFSLAVKKPFKKRDEENSTDFFDCKAWNKTGEFVSKYLHKGDKVIVEGYLVNTEYTGNNGVQHKSVVIVVNEIESAGYKNSNNNTTTSGGGKKANIEDDIPQMTDDDDLPF